MGTKYEAPHCAASSIRLEKACVISEKYLTGNYGVKL
jgi:hypothetical protein